MKVLSLCITFEVLTIVFYFSGTMLADRYVANCPF